MLKYLLILLLFACNTPDGNIRGRGFWLKESCVKSHKEKKKGYHFGYCWGALKWHWPWQCALNPCKETVCDQHRVDTVWAK
jgi:hypothetical protein